MPMAGAPRTTMDADGLRHRGGAVADNEPGVLRQVTLVEEVQAPVMPNDGVVWVHGEGVAGFHGSVWSKIVPMRYQLDAMVGRLATKKRTLAECL